MLAAAFRAAGLIRFIKLSDTLQSATSQIQRQRGDTNERLNHVSFFSPPPPPFALTPPHIQMTSEGCAGICLIDITVFLSAVC